MSFVSVADVVVEKLIPSAAPKQYNHPAGNFTHTYTSYDFGTPEAPSVRGALLELQVTKARVKRKISAENGKEDWKLIVIVTDPNDLNGLTRVDKALVNGAHKYRVQLASPNFNPENPGASYRNIWFHPSDPDTGVEIEGGDPMMAMKINGQSKFEVLLDAEGHTQAVDYHTLEGKELTASIIFAPRLYRPVGANKTILGQPVARSCMILGISDAGTVEGHTESDKVKAFLSQNPDIISTLAAEIEKLKTGQGSSLLQSAPAGAPKTTNSAPASGQTIYASGNQQGTPGGQQMNSPTGAPPNVPTVGEQTPTSQPTNRSPPPAQPLMQQPRVELTLPAPNAQFPGGTNQAFDLTQYINGQAPSQQVPGQQVPGQPGITFQRM